MSEGRESRIGEYHSCSKYYLVYRVDGDDEKLVNSGSASELCEIYDITKSCVSKAAHHHHLVKRKYHIYIDTSEDEDDED